MSPKKSQFTIISNWVFDYSTVLNPTAFSALINIWQMTAWGNSLRGVVSQQALIARMNVTWRTVRDNVATLHDMGLIDIWEHPTSKKSQVYYSIVERDNEDINANFTMPHQIEGYVKKDSLYREKRDDFDKKRDTNVGTKRDTKRGTNVGTNVDSSSRPFNIEDLIHKTITRGDVVVVDKIFDEKSQLLTHLGLQLNERLEQALQGITIDRLKQYVVYAKSNPKCPPATFVGWIEKNLPIPTNPETDKAEAEKARLRALQQRGGKIYGHA